MPVSIHVHHALADGYHVGLFVNKFQELMNGEFKLITPSAKCSSAFRVHFQFYHTHWMEPFVWFGKSGIHHRVYIITFGQQT